jgi:hypothetical protein
MKFTNKIEVTDKEYFQKRYEISKNILSSVLTHEKLETLTEVKQQTSMIFNCISLADVLLKELGYFYKSNAPKDETSMHKLSDILNDE